MALETSHKALTEMPVSNKKISRGENPDRETNAVILARARNIELFDESGDTIRFGELHRNKKAIVILIRNFLCFMTKEYVDDLALIPESYLKEANVRLVVIGCAPHKFIKEFKSLTGFKYELYCDPDRHLYKALGCHDDYKRGPIRSSHHVKSGFVTGVIKSIWRGMKHREFQGDMNQQGGAFIIGPGDIMEYQHRDHMPNDHAPINEILQVAGVEQVSFKNDSPVIQI